MQLSECMAQNEFADFYDTHIDFVMRAAYVVFEDERDSLGVADLVMWYAFCHPDKFRGMPIGAVRSYLAAITRTRSIDVVRRDRRNRHTDISNIVNTHYEASDENIERSLEIKALADAVEGCVRSMSKTYRDTFVLKITQGMTLKEVSEKLGVPIDTVKSRWRRGLVIIERSIRSCGYGI